MAQVTQPANDRNYISGLGSQAPEAPGHFAMLPPVFPKLALHVISPAHRYHYKSIEREPDEAWLSHTGS